MIRFGKVALYVLVAGLLFVSFFVFSVSLKLSEPGATLNVGEPAEAQETGTCPDAQLIDTFKGNGDQQTDTFDTTTNSFRVSYETESTAGENLGILFVDVLDADKPNDLAIADISQNGSGEGETFANTPPGSYFLDISAANVNYTITVEQCEGDGASTNPGEGNGDGQDDPPAPAPDPPLPDRPQPKDEPNGDLMDAGGPNAGPVPEMPGGGCPAEFPMLRKGTCYSDS